MSGVRKVARIIVWAIGSVFGLALIAYAVLYLANLEDQPPSADIGALLASRPANVKIIDEGNSYLFMLGFSGPPEADPMTLGRERYEWMETAGPQFIFEDDPLQEDYDYDFERTGDIAAFSKTCSESEAECLSLLEADDGTLDQWIDDERWLFNRYIALTSMTEFHEAIPFEVLAPLPSYGVIVEGQRLMIADAWLSANRDDAGAVNEALERDLVYWRMVLEESDALITKMVASAAITRHFKLGNLVLRRLPTDSMFAGIPPSWRSEVSDAERSMRRCLAGEWTYFDVTTKRVVADNGNPYGDWSEFAVSSTVDHATWAALRAAWAAIKPLWQHQDLSNRQARLMLDLGNAFDVAYEDIPAVVGVADQLQESAYRPFSRLYNIASDVLMSSSYWTFSNYAVRVSDLEGIRRAALLVAELRADGVTRDKVTEHMLAGEIVDPYTNEPFIWLDTTNAIVFYGLEPNDRSKHEVIY